MRTFLACLLLLSCLLARPATAQTVVELRPGDVIDRPLIGLDTATYQSTVLYVAEAQQALTAADDRLRDFARRYQLSQTISAGLRAELRRCRAENVATSADVTALGQEAATAYALPVRPPLLLDSRFYKGVATGGAVAVLLRGVVYLVFHR